MLDLDPHRPVIGLQQAVEPLEHVHHALVELLKGVGKMAVILLITFLIIYDEIATFPGLLNVDIEYTWAFWAQITKNLFWAVSGLMLFVAAGDYIFNFTELEKKLKMTKKEVREEMKKREVDPHIKARIKKIQRDIVFAKTMKATKEATVVITNPTHYAVALKYEKGMEAPLVVAKGIDFVAEKMKELARDLDIPIVENKPLARTLYKLVEVGSHIPESLYVAVSEVIKYVIWLKGAHVIERKIEERT